MADAGSGTACRLPGGFIGDDDEVHRDVELVRLSGREEELLCDVSQAQSANVVSRLLARCVDRIGSVHPLTPELTSRLLIADRQFLLLKLRELTFGDRIAGTLVCPLPRCGAKVDIDFSTADIPITGCDAIAAAYRMELSEAAAFEDAAGARCRTITFRLPTGEDQEALGALLAENPARAMTALLERCIRGTDTDWDDVEDLVARLSPQAKLEIEQAMEAHAPRVDLEMDVACPECGRGFIAPFDLQDFFFGELRTGRDLLYRQVHYLAYHYHWGEREILDMPRDKRLAYIDILAEEIEALNSAG